MFDKESHTYTLDGVNLRGITKVIERQLFPDKYSGVPERIMQEAAQRGTSIHEMCEVVDDLGIESSFTDEVDNYLRIKKENNLRYETSEYLVSDCKSYASCIDKVYRVDDTTFHLADIKTTYKLDTEYVKWQLSIYAYLFELQNEGAKVGKLYAIWLRGDKSELVEVERVGTEKVKELLDCDLRGERIPITAKSDTTLPSQLRDAELQIAAFMELESEYAAKKKELTDGIMKEMVKAGVYSWRGDRVLFTRRKDGIRKTFDKDRFDKDYAGVYSKYLKETPVAGSLTIKLI